MVDFVYNTAGGEMIQGGTALDVLADAKVKWMLIASTSYAADRDDDLVDAAGANDAIDHEMSGTGYVAGYNGAGRHVLASRSITINKTSDRSEFDAADETWTAIDAGTVEQALVIKEDHLGVAGNDTETRVISHHDTNFPITTNGGDLTIQTPNDIIRLSTV